MWPFNWIREWVESGRRLRLAAAEINERIDDIAGPIRAGQSDTQIQASIQMLNDVTQTVKFGATGTETMRRKAL